MAQREEYLTQIQAHIDQALATVDKLQDEGFVTSREQAKRAELIQIRLEEAELWLTKLW